MNIQEAIKQDNIVQKQTEICKKMIDIIYKEEEFKGLPVEIY